MTSVVQLVAEVEVRGGVFTVTGPHLAVRPHRVAAPFASELRRLKPEVIALLLERGVKPALSLAEDERMAFEEWLAARSHVVPGQSSFVETLRLDLREFLWGSLWPPNHSDFHQLLVERGSHLRQVCGEWVVDGLVLISPTSPEEQQPVIEPVATPVPPKPVLVPPPEPQPDPEPPPEQLALWQSDNPHGGA